MNQTPPSSLPQPTRHCPEEQLLAAYVEQRLPEAKRQQVEAHVSACEYCVAQVGFLLNVQDAELPEVPAALLARVRQPAAAGSWWGGLSWRWAPAAAALAGVVVVASISMQRDSAVPTTGGERPPTRQQAATSTPAVTPPAMGSAQSSATPPSRETRSLAQSGDPLRLLEPRPGATVAPEAFDLRWTPVPRALFYEVRITTPSGQLVWSSKVEQQQVRVPVGAGLRPGAHFAWVRAQLPEGRLIRAQAVSFTVRE
ncbi:MAG: anti-sigma factor family protein [Terriglobales bacterium]